MRKVAFALVVVVGLALTVPGVSVAKSHKEHADATIRLSTGSVAVGIGYSWGGGTLTYHGKHYPISIDGLSVGDVGVSHATASGNVYHLKQLSDFEGTYTAASAGATIGGGGGATAMQNQNGVVIKLTGTSAGLKIKLAAEGVKLAFKK